MLQKKHKSIHLFIRRKPTIFIHYKIILPGMI